MPNRLLVFMNRKVLIEFSELCNFSFSQIGKNVFMTQRADILFNTVFFNFKC